MIISYSIGKEFSPHLTKFEFDFSEKAFINCVILLQENVSCFKNVSIFFLENKTKILSKKTLSCLNETIAILNTAEDFLPLSH